MGISAWITLLHNVSIQFGVTRYWTDKSKRDRETWLSLLLCCIQIGIDLQHVLQGIWNSGLSFSLSERDIQTAEEEGFLLHYRQPSCPSVLLSASNECRTKYSWPDGRNHQWKASVSSMRINNYEPQVWESQMTKNDTFLSWASSVIAGHLFELYTTSHQNEWGI